MVTIFAKDFYYNGSKECVAVQACKLEAKYPGILVHTENELVGRPFLDHFPLSAFCMSLTMVS